MSPSQLEAEARIQLYFPSAPCAIQAPELRGKNVGHQARVVGVIEAVKQIPPDLEAVPLLDVEVLAEGEVEIHLPRRPDHIPAQVALPNTGTELVLRHG